MAGRRRFRAVMLTTITTVAGLLPMALGLSGVSMVFGLFAAVIVAGLSVASGLALYLTVDSARERTLAALGRGDTTSGDLGVRL